MADKKEKIVYRHNEGVCDIEETRLDTMGKDVIIKKDGEDEIRNDGLDPKKFECKWIKIKDNGVKEVWQYSVVPKIVEVKNV